VDLSGVGIWDQRLRTGDPGEVADAAAELESLGYSALWIHDLGGDVFGALRLLLDATTTVTVATGILNLWMHSADDAAAGRAELAAAHPGRLMLGLGVSHAPIVDAQEPGRFANPLAAMEAYLDGLDAAPEPVPAGERMLAALRPRMLELAGRRTRGAFPYNMTPEHTRRAREALGPGALLATEQKVLLEADPATARAAARQAMTFYFRLPNYVNAWRWLGFTEDDLAGGGSDRFIDAVVAWGDEDEVRRRVQEHLDAGADHVCLQAIAPELKAARETWRALAP
jgi:probable F420-dependent oxidoreductase